MFDLVEFDRQIGLFDCVSEYILQAENGCVKIEICLVKKIIPAADIYALTDFLIEAFGTFAGGAIMMSLNHKFMVRFSTQEGVGNE